MMHVDSVVDMVEGVDTVGMVDPVDLAGVPEPRYIDDPMALVDIEEADQVSLPQAIREAGAILGSGYVRWRRAQVKRLDGSGTESVNV
jgi:hypothetical protein